MNEQNTIKNENRMVLTKDGIWMTYEEYIDMVKSERD